jgi:CBS domain-containing protein
MWWPALGGIASGLIGWAAPHTMGVGYDNIDALVQGSFGIRVLLSLCLLKFLSWVIALGSGTSGGTLAPLFIIGGSFCALIATGLGHALPMLGIDPRIAALVGMAAIFAGSARALLTAIVFAFETTHQPAALLPLLGGCATAYLISALTMRNTIMTEKIARRGVRVPSEYAADFLERVLVSAACTREVRSLKTSEVLGEVRRWMNSGRAPAQHQGYPVVDETGRVRGVVTRRDLLDVNQPDLRQIGELLRRGPIIVLEDHSLRDAADLMTAENVGRLIVVARDDPSRLTGFITRSDLLSAHARRLHEMRHVSRHIRIRRTLRRHFGGRQIDAESGAGNP